jgi:precorrin-6A/cobalt-precorrin-6A reductase
LIWIIGGTSETADLIAKLQGRVEYIVSVATYSGKEVLKDVNVIVSRMNYHEMLDFITHNNIDLVVDMSHPYAIEVSENARKACGALGIKYLRYIRAVTEDNSALYVNSIEECVKYLSSVKGCVLFTTGMKNIKDFEKIRNNNRFIYRVLPTTFSIQECVDNNIEMRNIIAMLGPFSEELNMAVFKEYKADYVVMKDSGVEGGTPEKVSGCLKSGIIPIVIGRRREEGIFDMDKLVEMIL